MSSVRASLKITHAACTVLTLLIYMYISQSPEELKPFPPDRMILSLSNIVKHAQYETWQRIVGRNASNASILT